MTLHNFVMFAASEKKMMGSLLGGAHPAFDIDRLMTLWKAGRLDLDGLITGRRPLEDINQAFQDLADGAESEP